MHQNGNERGSYRKCRRASSTKSATASAISTV
jgi:hypothetical protein